MAIAEISDEFCISFPHIARPDYVCSVDIRSVVDEFEGLIQPRVGVVPHDNEMLAGGSI